MPKISLPLNELSIPETTGTSCMPVLDDFTPPKPPGHQDHANPDSQDVESPAREEDKLRAKAQDKHLSPLGSLRLPSGPPKPSRNHNNL